MNIALIINVALGVILVLALIALLKIILFKVLPAIKTFNKNKLNKIRDEIIVIASSNELSVENQHRAEELTIAIGTRINHGKGNLKGIFSELSNKLLGTFLAHLLDKKYPDSVYKGIAVSLKKDRPKHVLEVLRYMEILNPDAVKKIQKYT